MNEEFIYNAPNYYLDFQSIKDDSNSDSSFFENAEEENDCLTEESGETTVTNALNGEVFERETSDTESEAVFFTPLSTDVTSEISTSTVFLRCHQLRKSLSLSNLPTDPLQPDTELEGAVGGLTLEEPQNPRPSSACSYIPPKTAKTAKAISQDHLNRLAQPKHFASDQNLTTMTLAEAVNKFQLGTPKRFRSKPSPKINRVAAPMPWGGTRGYTPNLITTKRSRPVLALSHDQKEMIEMEEAKKFKIKAKPVNQRILKGPLKPPVEKKALTVVEPFKLTQVRKKEVPVVEEKVPTFKAQPLPKTLNNPFKVRPSSVPTVKPQEPNFSKRLQKTPKKSVPEKAVTNDAKAPFKPTRTEVKPFSFEKRDQELKKKKEAFINEILQKEKEAREFHAKPPPKAILRSRNGSVDRMSEASSIKSFKKSTEELDSKFKARPATVLQIPPFKPKMDTSHFLEVEAFQFATEERIDARQKFDQKLKEREKKAAESARQREAMLKMLEEREVARIRKEAEHKAQPIRKYKEVPSKPPTKITEPVSPIFRTDRIRNKENIKN